jgi:hypothetical protein
MQGQPLELLGMIIKGLIPVVIFGLGFAGVPCIQHFTLRLILYWNGYIPWNYARFLDYGTELNFYNELADDIASSTTCCGSILPRWENSC